MQPTLTQNIKIGMFANVNSLSGESMGYRVLEGNFRANHGFEV